MELRIDVNRKLILKFYGLAFLLLSFSCYANNTLIDLGYQIKSRIPLSKERVESHYFSAAFSHDDNFFATVSPVGEHTNQLEISIYESSTGLLKYQTAVSDSDVTNNHQLAFSKNNEMLIFYGMISANQYLWKFIEGKEVILTCNGQMGGYVEDVSENNDTVLYRTVGDSYGNLCKSTVSEKTLLLDEIDSAIKIASGANRVRTYRKVLNNDKVVVPFSYTKNDKLKNIELPNRVSSDIELWDIGYLSPQEADFDLSFSMVDFEKKVIMLYESTPDKTIVNQWNYKEKSKLPFVELDFCIKHYSNYLITPRYLFVETCDRKAVLLKRKGHFFIKQWVFHDFDSYLGKASSIEKEALPQFLEKYLVFINSSSNTDEKEYVRVTLASSEVETWGIDNKLILIQPVDETGTLVVAIENLNGSDNYVVVDIEKSRIVAVINKFIAVSNDKKTLVSQDKDSLFFWNKL